MQRENYWVNKDSIGLLHAWCDFFFNGRFLGSQELIMVPQADIPPFVNTATPLSPIDLYRNFKATDAKALVLIQALAALNIYYGGNRQISKDAFGEFLHNLMFQALTREYEEIAMQFDNLGYLVIETLEGLLEKDQDTLEITDTLNNNVKKNI